MTAQDAAQLLLAVLSAILAITWHEAAHGCAALWLGDDTARRRGRLSLNPLRHVDPVGTLLLPGALLLGQWAALGRIVVLFGWAKPVPVRPDRFAHPRQGMALVAAAGPVANFLLAWMAGLLAHGLPLLPDGWQDGALDLLYFVILSNVALGLFNLLPVPPLDGGRIVVGLLPPRAAAAWARLERAGLLAILLCVFVLPKALAGMGVTFDPVGRALDSGIPFVLGLVLRLSFNAA